MIDSSNPINPREPLKVCMVCTGVGIMDRGIERFFRECFDGLHPLAEAQSIVLKLIKGREPESVDEHRRHRQLGNCR
jgi:hypothetical protein